MKNEKKRLCLKSYCRNCGEPIYLAAYGSEKDAWFHWKSSHRFCALNCKLNYAVPIGKGTVFIREERKIYAS